MLRLTRTCVWLSVFATALVFQANAQSTTHAFLWSTKTGMQDLGSLGGSSNAYGINYAGQVVGSYESGDTLRAFLWTKSGGMQDLGTLGGDYTAAAGINSAGQVVGAASTVSGNVHAFLWTAAAGMQDLGTLGGTYSDAGCDQQPR
jgi:probable HAF family extracellular repeat protein